MLTNEELAEAGKLVRAHAEAASKKDALQCALIDAIEKTRQAYAAELNEAVAASGAAEGRLREFVKAHKRDFADEPRSYAVDGWRFGLRKRPDSVKAPKDDEGTIAKLREKLGFLFVRPFYALDREALMRFLTRETDEEADPQITSARGVERLLEDLGIALKRGADKFFVERI